jgi:hypothetical protein
VAAKTIKPVGVMVAAGVVSWAVAAVMVDRQTRIEVLFGMLGPLAVVVATWLLAEWAYRHHTAELTSVMMTAFMLKMAFFAGYVAVMLRVAGFRPVPFVASFTSYFIALYLIEALYLKRLFSNAKRHGEA